MNTTKSWLSAVVILVCLPQCVFAFTWQDLWWRADQQGARALAHKNPAQAAELFQDPAWKAAAHYRAGHYQQTKDILSVMHYADANYNRGNALAQLGDYEAAIHAYEATLKLNPNDADAKFNLALLKKLLSEKKPPQKQDNKNQQKNEPPKPEPQNKPKPQNNSEKKSNDKDSPAQNKPPQNQKPSQDPTQNNNPPPENKQTNPPEKMSGQPEQPKPEPNEPDPQALKQWLQQIPDDPGGLLRRKFYRDHEKTLQQNF